MAMHHFGDCLWACTDNPSVPNNGFHEDGVGPIAGEEQVVIPSVSWWLRGNLAAMICDLVLRV